MFTLKQKMFIVQCYFRNGERLENDEWGVFEEFQQKFPDFQGTYQQLTQKAYKWVNMFLETDSVLRKKNSWKYWNKDLQRPQINPSGD
jgi:hypothetical protein